jgi:hypothetical protein
MRNHDQKVKDMTESVLPSTDRVRARQDKRAINRSERRVVGLRLHAASTYPDPDDFDGDLVAVDRNARLEARFERRLSDKVAPLVRWAERRVAIDPVLSAADHEDRLAYFRGLLPSNKIGRHALGHVDWAIGPHRSAWFHETAAESDPSACELGLREAAALVIETGAHRRLNARLKTEATTISYETTNVDGERMTTRRINRERLLMGLHDIEEFSRGRVRLVVQITREVAGMPPCSCGSCRRGR